MKKSISSLMIVAILTSNLSWAKEPVTEEEPVIYPMNINQVAPFPGVLFNKTASARVTVDYKEKKEEIDIAVKKAVNDAEAIKDKVIADHDVICAREKVELGAHINTLDGTLKLKEEEIISLKAQIADAPSRSTWFGIGFATGFAATILTVFAIGTLTK